MDIYQQLIRDHQTQKELAEKITETTGDSPERRTLYAQFKTELESHANAEEQTLYAKLIEQPDSQEQARHSITEHEDAAELLKELDNLDMSLGAWIQKFEKLRSEVIHHVEEEEKDVFTLARKLIDDDEAQQLGEVFKKRKKNEAANA